MRLEQLAEKIIMRDEDAFHMLYDEMRRTVYAVCLSVVKNPAMAEELAQDTFVTVWTKCGTFEGRGFKAWILKIAKNKSLNALQKARRETVVDPWENEYVYGRYETKADLGLTVRAALEILNDEDRQIVLLKNSGVKTKEIAEVMGMPRGTVSWRYSEAIKRLKAYLEDDE